jgi:hypothetical protein
MDKEFVPYEEALALKGLGFKEDCLGFWSKIHGLYITKTTGESKLFEGAGECKAPLYQQAFRWFRDKHQLMSQVTYGSIEFEKGYGFNIYQCSPREDGFTHLEKCEPRCSNTYQEAELACLRKLIEIVKQQKDVENRN